MQCAIQLSAVFPETFVIFVLQNVLPLPTRLELKEICFNSSCAPVANDAVPFRPLRQMPGLCSGACGGSTFAATGAENI